MFALIIPWAVLLLLVIALICAKKRKSVSVILVIVAIGLNWLGECIPFRLFYPIVNKEGKVIKVLSYNIDGTSGDVLDKSDRVRSFLREYSPDIVFIAEYDDFHPTVLDSLLKDDFKYSNNTKEKYFQYFYGKVPIINTRRLLDKEGKEIGVYACSIVMHKDTIDLFGCHLASNNYSPSQDRISPDSIHDGTGLITYLQNIKSAGERRTIEVETLIDEMAISQRQTIVMGDLNDVNYSKPLRLLESSGLKDAWWEGGVGCGATINTPLPYRIDHIMHTNDLKLKKIRVIKSDISDHNALYAELYIK